ncbi:RNA polymerase sigma factor [Caulobacter sp. S45]|uniref:RNA polymerase sigma factor n=1 Tax=Caulobacter sp. S45 TaxID=1641861 RepID=UPI00131D5A30|nr:sigma-70 family RNA polymerase sigma factor [Caulobacter sp. S45]
MARGNETRGPPLSALPDVELAALASAGGRQAFGELVRRHGSAVRALLRRMGADPATADDVAQDAFLAAYERIGELRGHGAFAGWIKRIAARLYIKRWRRRGRLEALDDAEAPDLGVGGEGSAAFRLDLDDALQALSEAERLCVSLCCGAGLTHAEAADALKTPLGTVKSHVRRGLDKLKARLSPQDNGATGGGAESMTARGEHG